MSQQDDISPMEKCMRYEMGFALIVKAMIEAKKPLIGHNCMYDWIYVYNQFVGKLPDTYLEFAKEWHACFPNTFDTKVLAFNSKSFFQTGLGNLYEKVTNDEKFKHNIKNQFDILNNFSNYEGQALLSHYHEAAYDAHMTGVVFMHILKLKEIDRAKNPSRGNGKN